MIDVVPPDSGKKIIEQEALMPVVSSVLYRKNLGNCVSMGSFIALVDRQLV